MSSLHIPADDSVLLRITHSNLSSFSSDLRFSLQSTLESVKEKLWLKCGTSMDSMRLELYDDCGAKLCADLAGGDGDGDGGSRLLGFFSPHDGYRIHVVDLDPASLASSGWLEDTSLVEKYTMSEEEYNKLDCKFRKFKEKIISQNPSVLNNTIPDNYMEDHCAKIKVGDRCEVELGGKRGIVKFVGKGENIAPGFWVGIQYDEPLGKHDGMVKGKRYFECPPQHGALLRPDKIKVGDYPERDPFEDEEI